MNQYRVTGAEYAAALAAGQTEAETELRVQAVRYVPGRDAIEIVTTRNTGSWSPGNGRRIAGRADRRSGKARFLAAIELEDQDIHISVHGFMTAILPPRVAAAFLQATTAKRPRMQSVAGTSIIRQAANGTVRPEKMARLYLRYT